MSYSLFRIKEHVEAEQAVNRAPEIDPNDGDVLMLKAGIVESMGRKGEARALVKRATQVDPHMKSSIDKAECFLAVHTSIATFILL